MRKFIAMIMVATTVVCGLGLAAGATAPKLPICKSTTTRPELVKLEKLPEFQLPHYCVTTTTRATTTTTEAETTTTTTTAQDTTTTTDPAPTVTVVAVVATPRFTG